MMKLTFKEYGEMELEPKIRSIFDCNIAGQYATDGNYYCIHLDHQTHKLYALTKESHFAATEMGHTLMENETALFGSEKVRGMTYIEEMKWNQDELFGVDIDLWGNIKAD